MDGFATPSECTLVEDPNDRAKLGDDDTTGCHNGDVNELVVINALHTYAPVGPCNEAHVIACNASIGTSVNQKSSAQLLVTVCVVNQVNIVN